MRAMIFGAALLASTVFLGDAPSALAQYGAYGGYNPPGYGVGNPVGYGGYGAVGLGGCAYPGNQPGIC
jgi:hypothetical protein